jgi:hypothetical protein
MVRSYYSQARSQQLVWAFATERVRSRSSAHSLKDLHRLHLRVGAVLFYAHCTEPPVAPTSLSLNSPHD